MFVELLIVTFVIALAMSALVALLFAKPMGRILSRLVSDELASTWGRYIIFAIFVVGISGGARLWEVEKYITPDKDGRILQLTSGRWIVEVYKTVIGWLQSIAWMLLVFFLFALIAYVTVRGFEMRKAT
jgi:multidrug efflux pump subunit AcrB